jgi:hypothetical protein
METDTMIQETKAPIFLQRDHAKMLRERREKQPTILGDLCGDIEGLFLPAFVRAQGKPPLYESMEVPLRTMKFIPLYGPGLKGFSRYKMLCSYRDDPKGEFHKEKPSREWIQAWTKCATDLVLCGRRIKRLVRSFHDTDKEINMAPQTTA